MIQHAKGLKPTPQHVRERFGSYAFSTADAHALPTRISYSGNFDAIDDQEQTNFCVIHGAVGIIESFVYKHHGVRIEISRRALGWMTKRQFENGVFVDDGFSVGEALQCFMQYGWVPESDWPWDPGNLFAPVPDNLWRRDYPLAGFDAVRPTSLSFRSALFHRGPIIIGGTWPAAWEQPDASGALPAGVPAANDGHCTVLPAYDDDRIAASWPAPGGGFFDRNSWGPGWGSRGYCWMPYAAIDDPNLAPWEAYTIRLP